MNVTQVCSNALTFLSFIEFSLQLHQLRTEKLKLSADLLESKASLFYYFLLVWIDNELDPRENSPQRVIALSTRWVHFSLHQHCSSLLCFVAWTRSKGTGAVSCRPLYLRGNSSMCFINLNYWRVSQDNLSTSERYLQAAVRKVSSYSMHDHPLNLRISLNRSKRTTQTLTKSSAPWKAPAIAFSRGASVR